MANKNPCLNCTRVKKPKDCTLKGCTAWREWWLNTWENMRSKYCVEVTDEEDSDGSELQETMETTD